MVVRCRLLVPLLLAVSAAAGCGGNSPGTTTLDRQALMDPTVCQTCHPAQYQQWAQSMHAYATDDPVFRAMNARAQRETSGGLGTFCLNCHAPMAVRDQMTDGTNLDAIPAASKGVTCYFCHSVTDVTDTHNNPLQLASDNHLFGPFSDPAPGSPHNVSYGRFLDGATPESANACGSCHDIVNLQGAHVERTFGEWKGTTLSQLPNGESCAQCHMAASSAPAASTTPDRIRRVHDHGFPAVDLQASDVQPQRAAAQALLDTALQETLCLNPATRRLQLTIDNTGASGHAWPSGATPDRRAWVELTAYQGGQVIYASGNPQPAGSFPSALPLEESSPDPDLWLIRDCIYDGGGNPLIMFWQTEKLARSNQLPGLLIQTVSDPTTYQTHFMREFPSAGTLSAVPDHVTVQVHLQAIGDDVLNDLVASGDLDPAVPPQIARYTLGGGASLDWTPSASNAFQAIDANNGAAMTCVATGAYKSNTTPAVSHARCAGLAPP
ncbi:MAG TPA: multiheme c-type cytochrome [Polyangia bacterium]|nr:multiheme c-type cytochrome [Polyangia bacterium]